jgi:basic amino acid/polyamine antiporter, APA family
MTQIGSQSSAQATSQPSAQSSVHRTFGYAHATALVIAAMIGTGVFTSLGMQLSTIPSVSAVLLLWVLGGLSSVCGALCYAELGAAYPRSGGEYHLLSIIYSPRLGFVAGVGSIIAGLAAPVAASAVAFSRYVHNLVAVPEWAAVVGVIVVTTLVHSINTRLGARLHSWITYFNIVLILAFVVAAFALAPFSSVSTALQGLPQLAFTANDVALVLSPSYAIAFVFVSYAYLGWNTSVYVIDEVREPVITGVLVVMVLYVLLNAAFLTTASIGQLAGNIDVGYVAAQQILPRSGAILMSALIALALLASISAYTVLAPRIWSVLSEDFSKQFSMLRFFAPDANSAGQPQAASHRAFWAQALLAAAIALSSTFDAILIYAGFILGLFNCLAVLGVIILRRREPSRPRPYKVWGYPLTPLVFVIIAAWMTLYGVTERPKESLFVVLTFAAIYGVSFLGKKDGDAKQR